MKSQRRHKLQENDLSKVITKAPGFWQESGGKFLAACVAVLVIALLVRYRITSNREAVAAAVADLATARTSIEEMQGLSMYAAQMPPSELATRRRTFYNDANDAIGRSMSLSDDPKIAAEALLAKGDLAWTLATLPPIPGAATQPALSIRDPKELLSGANEAYQTIINNYGDQKYATIAARFGLAAIAEQKGDFTAAKSQYEKLAVETKDFPAYQQLASARLNNLDDLRKPVYLAPAATQPFGAATATRPAMDIPSLLRPPTTASSMPGAMTPSTTRAVAASVPATKPTTLP